MPVKRRRLLLLDERTQLQKINGADRSILLRSCARRVTVAVDTRTGSAGLEATRVHSLADAFAVVPDPRSPLGPTASAGSDSADRGVRGQRRPGRADRDLAVGRRRR
jgi:hypothetical protein